ncbi:hypothetical protein [Pelosinus sp. IPA-1]|uniref:hypothetical protein n=1 Tax=Pelosinus sp. IPA-1 TaxID=3029569 RepID=UPI002436290D|nr:hypothetical protein [Pelosinus sp. IPA-1]GMA99147.1 hypothetical protein PIPA1_19470 [Pelosinus sp. IPA-1]
MRQNHKSHILKLKQIAKYKAIKIFKEYRLYMADVPAVVKMLTIHKITVEKVKEAIIYFYRGYKESTDY